MVVGLLDNESPDSNRLTLVTPKSENDVRLQATLGNQNPMGLPVGAVRENRAALSEEYKNWIIENHVKLINFRDALYGTNELQDHLKAINSPLWVGSMK